MTTIINAIGARNNSNGLRYHLSQAHQMKQFSFKSQEKWHKKKKIATIDQTTKKVLDQWAVRAIVQDNLPFGVFRKKGMKNFIDQCKPGYTGPNRDKSIFSPIVPNHVRLS